MRVCPCDFDTTASEAVDVFISVSIDFGVTMVTYPPNVAKYHLTTSTSVYLMDVSSLSRFIRVGLSIKSVSKCFRVRICQFD
jgi:hypothetical protein